MVMVFSQILLVKMDFGKCGVVLLAVVSRSGRFCAADNSTVHLMVFSSCISAPVVYLNL